VSLFPLHDLHSHLHCFNTFLFSTTTSHNYLDERSFIFRSFLHRDKCISTIETYIAKFKAEEERQARKKEKVLKYAVKQSAKSTKESLDKFAETSRESFSHIAVAGRSVRSSIFSGIASVFRGPTDEEAEGAEGTKEAKSNK